MPVDFCCVIGDRYREGLLYPYTFMRCRFSETPWLGCAAVVEGRLGLLPRAVAIDHHSVAYR